MKMYIVIKDWVPSGHAVNCAAHAGLMGWLEFQDREDTKIWLRDSFKKVTCMVSEAEFEALKAIEHHKVVTESGLDGAEIGMVFAPRAEWPAVMKTLKLWR
jgi:hypothetical protein